MSFWYDIKNKNYASNEKTSWLRAYVDRIAAAIRGENSAALNAHLAGTGDRHTADTIECTDGKTVQATLNADAAALAAKVDKVSGKALSTNDYTAADKAEVAKVKNKVDKITGKGLSTNDYTAAEKTEVAKIKDKVDKVDGKGLSANDYNDTEKAEVAKVKNKVDKADGKSLIDANIADSLTYDSTNGIINSDANLLLANTSSVAAYNGTFRGDIKVGQLGTNKWAYTISPITGFSTSVDVTCTSGNVVHNLSAKADTTNVLTRNNTQTFTPTGDYQPATKKYVDDAIAALKLDLGLD